MDTIKLKPEEIRQQFSAIQCSDTIFLDGPAGVQIPDSVIDRISTYYRKFNSNVHGSFAHSKQTDEFIAQCRSDVAHFLNAFSPSCISFGANMTSLNFKLSYAIRKILKSGDEIIITALDHESNRAPWIAMEEIGVLVKEIKMLPNGKLDYQDLEHKMSKKTKANCYWISFKYFWHSE